MKPEHRLAKHLRSLANSLETGDKKIAEGGYTVTGIKHESESRMVGYTYTLPLMFAGGRQ